MKPSRLDRVIEFIAPGWGRKRAISRAAIAAARQSLSVYSAAEKSRLTYDWKTTSYSANTAVLADMDAVNARARQAERDDWLASSIVRGYRRHIVGTGITSRSTARNPKTNADLADYNQKMDDLFTRWATTPALCDTEGVKTFCEIQGQLVSELVTVGQAFVVMSYVPTKENVGLKLTVIEVEQLDKNLTTYTDGEETRKVKHGIEVDDYGKPVAYHVYTQEHPLESTLVKPERIPAERVLRFFRQGRPRQIHALSMLAPILKKLRSLQLYEEYNLIRAQFEACLGGFITQKGKGSPADNWISANTPTTNTKGQRELSIEPGMVHRLGAEEGFEPFIPSSPGEFYDLFVRAQIHHASAGCGLDYATTSRDFSQTTYGGQRQGMLERNSETDPLQQLLIDQIIRPVRKAYVGYAAIEKRVPMPFYMTDSAWQFAYESADYQAPPKPWLDPRNEAQAIATMLDYGLTTRMKELNILGEGWRDVFKQHRDERQQAKDYGIVFPDMAGDDTGTPQDQSPDKAIDQKVQDEVQRQNQSVPKPRVKQRRKREAKE